MFYLFTVPEGYQEVGRVPRASEAASGETVQSPIRVHFSDVRSQVRFLNMTQGVLEEASCVMSELSLRAPEGASACSWRAPSRRCEETTGRSSGVEVANK